MCEASTTSSSAGPKSNIVVFLLLSPEGVSSSSPVRRRRRGDQLPVQPRRGDGVHTVQRHLPRRDRVHVHSAAVDPRGVRAVASGTRVVFVFFPSPRRREPSAQKSPPPRRGDARRGGIRRRQQRFNALEAAPKPVVVARRATRRVPRGDQHERAGDFDVQVLGGVERRQMELKGVEVCRD